MATNASLETQLNNLEDLRLPELQACFKQVVGKATRAPNRKFLIRRIREAAAARVAAEEPAATPKAAPTTTPAESPTAGQSAPPVLENPAARKRKATKTTPTKEASRPKKKASTPATSPEPAILTGPLGPVTVGKPAAKGLSTKKAKKAPIRVVAPQPAPAPEPESEATDDDSTEAAPPRPDLKTLSVNDLRVAYLEEVGRATKSIDRNYLIWKIRQARKGKVPVGPVSRTRSDAAGTLRVLPLRMPNETVDALDDVWRRHGLSSRMEMFRCALHQYLTSLEEHEAAAVIHR